MSKEVEEAKEQIKRLKKYGLYIEPFEKTFKAIDVLLTELERLENMHYRITGLRSGKQLINMLQDENKELKESIEVANVAVKSITEELDKIRQENEIHSKKIKDLQEYNQLILNSHAKTEKELEHKDKVIELMADRLYFKDNELCKEAGSSDGFIEYNSSVEYIKLYFENKAKESGE